MGLLIAKVNISVPYIFVIYITTADGTETEQRQTLRWLVNVEGSSQI
jgi:hypothetical protein